MTKTSGNNEWYTPAKYIEAARAVLGTIDLDPASCDEAQAIVQADRYHTRDDDGLLHAWSGRVFMNPPYARQLISDFVRTLLDHYQAGHVPAYICLVNDCMDTQWAHDLLCASASVCFVRGRIGFDTPAGAGKGKPPRGQVFYYAGDSPALFWRHFRAFGTVIDLE